MGKDSPPAAPDYTQQVEKTSAADRQLVTGQTYANRPSQTTPWGTTQWDTSKGTDPATGAKITQWDQTQTLNPQSQRALDATLGQQVGRTELAQSLLGRVEGQGGFGTDPSYAGMTDVSGYDASTLPGVRDFNDQGLEGLEGMRQRSEDAAYGRSTARLDPQWEQAGEKTEMQLRNQGLVPGTEAYDRAMQQHTMARTDAYGQARAAATAEGRQETALGASLRGQAVGEREQMSRMDMAQRGMYGGEQQTAAGISGTQRQQEISEYLQQRGIPLNEVNALMSGQQVAQPGMPSFSNAGRAQAPNYLGAAQSGYQAQLDQYNAGQAQDQGLMSGVFGLGSTAMMMSDRRLKENIVPIGEHNGLMWYTFNYIWDKAQQIGVMADEVLKVKPEAVGELGGYLTVNYGAL